MPSASCNIDSDTHSEVHVDWIRPDDRFGTDDEDAFMVFEAAEAASTKWGPPASLTSPPFKRASIGRVLDHSGDMNSGAIYSRFASCFHAHTDANALQTAGQQDGQQKSLNDSAASSSPPVLKLMQARGHDSYLPWAHTLTAFSCSLKMGLKVLTGDVLLSDVFAA